MCILHRKRKNFLFSVSIFKIISFVCTVLEHTLAVVCRKTSRIFSNTLEKHCIFLYKGDRFAKGMFNSQKEIITEVIAKEKRQNRKEIA